MATAIAQSEIALDLSLEHLSTLYTQSRWLSSSSQTDRHNVDIFSRFVLLALLKSLTLASLCLIFSRIISP